MIRRALTLIHKICRRDGFLLLSLRDLPIDSTQKQADFSPLTPFLANAAQAEAPDRVLRSQTLQRGDGSAIGESFGGAVRLGPATQPPGESKMAHVIPSRPTLSRSAQAEVPGALFLFQAGKNTGPVLIKEAMK